MNSICWLLKMVVFLSLLNTYFYPKRSLLSLRTSHPARIFPLLNWLNSLHEPAVRSRTATQRCKTLLPRQSPLAPLLGLGWFALPPLGWLGTRLGCCDGCVPLTERTVLGFRQHQVVLAEVSPAVHATRTVPGQTFSGTKESRPCLTRS